MARCRNRRKFDPGRRRFTQDEDFARQFDTRALTPNLPSRSEAEITEQVVHTATRWNHDMDDEGTRASERAGHKADARSDEGPSRGGLISVVIWCHGIGLHYHTGGRWVESFYRHFR